MEQLTAVLASLNGENLVASGLRILLVLVIVWSLLFVVRRLLKHLELRLVLHAKQSGEVLTEAEKRAGTLVRLMQQGVTIIAWVTTALVILRQLGVDITPILASAGVVGLAIGFGAQNLVRDVLSGFFIILENQIRVGDVAVINGTGGLVEEINFRTTVLRDLKGVVHIFPNGAISSLSNMTTEWSAYIFDIGVAYKEDTDHVVEVMKQVGAELRADPHYGLLILEDLEIFGVDQFADSAVIIKGRVKTVPIKQWEVGREYLRRLKKAFDREGIEIPFPHRSLYFGEASKPILAQLLDLAPEPGRKPTPPVAATPSASDGGLPDAAGDR